MASFMYEKIKAREQKMSNNNKLPESDDRIEVIINYKKNIGYSKKRYDARRGKIFSLWCWMWCANIVPLKLIKLSANVTLINTINNL